MSVVSALPTIAAGFTRELAEHRLNRFLHVHLALAAAVGLLPLFTPDAAARSASVWILQAVMYCLSLSALLLGLSAAQGDADEFPLLFAQPVSRGAWLLGKMLAVTMLLVLAAALVGVPAALLGGLSATLAAMAAAAAGVTVALAAVGMAVGFWVRDHVRALLTAMGIWFALLFGTDLVLLAVAGAPFAQAHPSLWLAPLMVNPLDALRITVLFTFEETAPAGLESGALAGWWIRHGGLWLAGLLGVWTIGSAGLAWAGASRRLDA